MYETISEHLASDSETDLDGTVPDALEGVPRSSMTVRDFEARIRRYNSDLESGSVTFRAAVILLAGAEYGHNIDRIARRTGYDRGFVARVARRLTDNGVWKAGVTVADWSSSDEASGTFWNDVAVAEGKMCRRIGSTGQIEWAPAGFWNKSFHYVQQADNPGLSAQYDDPTAIAETTADSEDSAEERDGAFLIGDDADAEDRGGEITGFSRERTDAPATEIIGPVPGAPIELPRSRTAAVVPPLDDLFRDVIWIG